MLAKRGGRVLQHRERPAGALQHAGDHAPVRLEHAAAANADLHLARAHGAHRHVEREHQHMHAGRVGAAHQVEADRVVVLGKAVELQPEHVRRDLGDLLDGGAAGDAERVWHARALRGLGQQLVGAGPDHDRAAHRRHAERRGVFAAEQLDIDRRHARHDAVARHHLDGVERRPVVLDAGVVTRAAVAVFEGEMRQPPLRATAKIVDGRIPALMLERSSASRVEPGMAAAMAVMSCMERPQPAFCFPAGASIARPAPSKMAE